MIEENQLISHLYQNRDNGQWMIQTNDEHQKGVADMAASFAGQFGLPSWGRALGLLHDKGKERAAFQQYIRKMNGLPTSDKKRYDDHTHAFVGGILAKELMGKDVSHLLVNQIISHHTGLHDFGDVENILKERLLSKEINEGDISINKPLLFQEFIDSPFSKSKVEWKHFHHLSRMLFSCLVDADRLDTERFMDVESWRKRGNSATLADLLPQLEAYMQKLQSNAADTKVNRIRQQVKEQCSRTSSSEKGFYSLTVPTGGGFYGNNPDITIDMQEPKEISSAFINTLLNPGDAIFGATGLKIEISDDGKVFREIASKKIPVLEKGTKMQIRKEEISFDKVKTRYVRIIAETTSKLPAWHSMPGKNAFLFVDEIGVE